MSRYTHQTEDVMTTQLRSSVTWTLRAALIPLAIGGISACGGESAGGEAEKYPFEPVTAASLASGDAVPTPNGEVVLTVADGAGADVAFDLATLERAGMVQGELFE